jgi:cell division protein FtsW (lipid II flippase)
MLSMGVTVIYTLITVTKHVKKSDTTQQAYQHWVPFIIFASCVLVWFYLEPALFHAYPRTVIYALGLCFGEMVVCEFSRNFH